MRRLTRFFLSGAFFAGLTASAQTVPPPHSWEQANLGFGLSSYYGDSNYVSLSIQLNYTQQVGRVESDGIVNTSFSQSEGQRLTDVEEVDWAFRIMGKNPKKQRWFPMIHTWAEHDELPGIDYRLAAGPGIGTHVRDDSKMRVTLEGGFAYTDERQIHPQKFATLFFDPSVRWTINQKTSLQEKVNFRYNAERSRDVRVHSESDLSVQMSQRVSLSFSVTLDFDNEPVQGHKKLDMQTSTNVSFNLQHGHQ